MKLFQYESILGFVVQNVLDDVDHDQCESLNRFTSFICQNFIVLLWLNGIVAGPFDHFVEPIAQSFKSQLRHLICDRETQDKILIK